MDSDQVRSVINGITRALDDPDQFNSAFIEGEDEIIAKVHEVIDRLWLLCYPNFEDKTMKKIFMAIQMRRVKERLLREFDA